MHLIKSQTVSLWMQTSRVSTYDGDMKLHTWFFCVRWPGVRTNRVGAVHSPRVYGFIDSMKLQFWAQVLA